MRELLLHMPRGKGRDVLKLAQEKSAGSFNLLSAEGADGEGRDYVLGHLANDQVEGLLGELEQIENLQVTLLPTGVIPVWPASKEPQQNAVDVAMRSPVEVFLGGLQSIGSWTGFLGYSAAGGVIVWIGFFTNTVYLLTAAMLIAPFAGPAMNAALATARGDGMLLLRTLGRYVASLLLAIVVAFILSLVLQQEFATEQMVDRSQISALAVLLPLVAGAAGALNLVQSERSSLVSGAATGMLVAASIAPPVGVIGMGAAIGEWDLVKGAAFVLVLQLAGINLAGAAVFRLFGVSTRGACYQRGSVPVSIAAVAVSLLVLGGLLFWQFNTRPELQRSSRAMRAMEAVRKMVKEEPVAQLVDVEARFTRPNIPGQNTLLVELVVQAPARSDSDDSAIRKQLTQRVQQGLQDEGFNVTPLVDVTVVNPPEERR